MTSQDQLSFYKPFINNAEAMNSAYTAVSGVILAGGRGSRMGGQDKGLMPIAGRPLIEHLVAALQPQVANIIINANRHRAEYEQYGWPVVTDELSDFQGPLAGMASALNVAQTAFIITLPCDGPRLAADYVTRLYQAAIDQQCPIAVAHDGERLQPVHALIARDLLPSLQQFLASGERKIDRWYGQESFCSVDCSDIAAMFANINTPEQHAAWLTST